MSLEEIKKDVWNGTAFLWFLFVLFISTTLAITRHSTPFTFFYVILGSVLTSVTAELMREKFLLKKLINAREKEIILLKEKNNTRDKEIILLKEKDNTNRKELMMLINAREKELMIGKLMNEMKGMNKKT